MAANCVGQHIYVKLGASYEVARAPTCLRLPVLCDSTQTGATHRQMDGRENQ